ncbi:hypothetical protein PPERSA_07223 [Pseudocohnilembus persalinus]|uniref:Uncharacterized protein n=1 Tax=Pseudocohnilembus persalinus TaxID=266149 RepID=A0A0V0QD25_PSEPJ|nr:hypothetical protein PPERSA_07223 [Pseudocohnilembus persalinus]|eukprot:KRX00116.1 hypothetical protein PPERSA_07223 [Pseudocohnilembus persalinus]
MNNLQDPSFLENRPKGHEKYSNDDIDKCPVMQIKAKQLEKDQNQLQKKNQIQDIENPKKMKMPKGGCPFMPSDKKKNPMLGVMENGYDVAFISPYEYFFSMTPLLDIAIMDKPQSPKERKVFDSYPIYLKHSLMIDDDENMKKVREMEISKRFFCYDRFREKGNKEYYKGNYETALSFYERAYHCFRWLSYKPPKDDSESDEEEQTKQQNDQNQENKQNNEEVKQEEEKQEDEQEIKAQNQKINKNLKEKIIDKLSDKEKQLFGVSELSQKEEQEVQDYIKQMKQQKKEFRQKYKNLMKTYNDETVVLHDGEELTDAQDIEMRDSMLHIILMLIGVVYIKLKHFKLAITAIEESQKIHDKSTQLEYRKSQAITYNKWSTLEELEEGKKLIDRAIEMKKYEKLFVESQPGMLKIMNLHNHEEAYRDQAIQAVQSIHERKEFETEKVRAVMKRQKRYQEIIAEMIADGKTPQNFEQEKDEFDDQLEMMVVHEMVKKYYKAIEFYTETKKPDQVSAAKYQLQKLLETVQEMVYFWELDWNCWAAQEVNKEFKFDLKDEKMLKDLNKIKKKMAKEIFDSAKNFNFEIFKWALNDVMDAKRQRDREIEEERKKQKKQQDKMGPQSLTSLVINNTIKSPQFFFSLSFLMVILIVIYSVLGNNGSSNEILQQILKTGFLNMNSK